MRKIAMVGEEVVKHSNNIKTLPEGAGEDGSLKPKGNFERSPHPDSPDVHGWQDEIWRTVQGWPDYEVSNLGRLRSLDRSRPHNTAREQAIVGKLLNTSQNRDGYTVATLRKVGLRKIMRVHRLVAVAFVPNPKSLPFINHIDCARSHNIWTNLEWCTQLENIQHSDALGRMQRNYWTGKRSPSAMLSDEQVRFIRRMYATGNFSWESLAKEFGISKRAIGRAIQMETYADVQ